MKGIVCGLVAIGVALCLALALCVALVCRLPVDVTVVPPAGSADGDFRWIAFEDLSFQEPIVRDRLVRMQSEASAIATPGWQHVPWHWQGSAGGRPPTHFIFATQWCSRPSGLPYCVCSRDLNPCHKIALSASPRDSKAGQPKEIYRWSLRAEDYPEDEGWGVWLSYSENWFEGAQIQEHFMVFLHHTRWSPNERSEPELRLPCDNYVLRHKFGDFEHVFVASLEKQSPQFHQAREYVSSPTRLRQTMIEAQDALEAILSERIEAGMVTRVLDHALLVSSPPTRNPPEWGLPQPTEFEPPFPAKYMLTPEQKQELREQLARDLEQRRQLARSQADEIHTAMEKAFPLGKLLKEIDAKPSTD